MTPRQEVLQRVKAACQRVGRNPAEVRLLAVSKRQPVDKVVDLSRQGQTDFAENYVQELLEKSQSLNDPSLHWHLIGHLQKNKIKLISGRCALIHSVDSLALAEALNRKAEEKKITEKILLQVNPANENSKEGFSVKELKQKINQILTLKNLEVHGFMTMPPLQDQAELNRSFFRVLRELRDEVRRTNAGSRHPLKELSMGTSHDFEVAIEEGATLIRLGTVLFGTRTG